MNSKSLYFLLFLFSFSVAKPTLSTLYYFNSSPFQINAENLVDYQFTYKPLFERVNVETSDKRPRIREDGFQLLPEEICINIFFNYIDLRDFIPFATTSKAQLDICFMFIQHFLDQEARFKLNVPKSLALAVYAAFFHNKLDYSAFSVLNGKVLNVEDFIAMNFFIGLRITDEASWARTRLQCPNFLKHYNSSIQFIRGLADLSKRDASKEYLVSFRAFQYLIQIVLKRTSFSFQYETEYFLPYTYQALNCFAHDINSSVFKSSFALHVRKVPITSIPVILRRISCHIEFGKQLLAHLVSLMVTIEEFVKYLEAFDVIFEDQNLSALDPELMASFKFVSALSYSYPLSPLTFTFYLKESFCYHISQVLGQCKLDFSKYFYQITPQEFLHPNHLVLKHLLLQSDNINLDFNEWGTFNSCFTFFAENIIEPRIDILKAFLDYALERDDFTIPKISEYSSISSIFLLLDNNPEAFKQIIEDVRSKGKRLSFYKISFRTCSEKFAVLPKSYLQKVAPYITSHFDLLPHAYSTDEISQILKPNQINSTLRIPLSIFFNPFEKSIGLLRNFRPLPDKMIEFIRVEREWTYFELSIALGNFVLAEFIFNHPEFDRNLLNHEIEGINGLGLIFENILDFPIIFDGIEYHSTWRLLRKIDELKRIN